MKLHRHICTYCLLIAYLVLTGGLVSPDCVRAQSPGSPAGSEQWFHWSDYRAACGGRIFFARLASGSVEVGGQDFDLKSAYGMNEDPVPFREFWAVAYIDRLGFRVFLDEDNDFRGRLGGNRENSRISQLDIDWTRVGFDLDLVRYPFARVGINADYHFSEIKLYDRRNPDPQQWTLHKSRNPITVGVHSMAIPGRIKGLPIVGEARARFPFTYFQGQNVSKVVDWEIAAGVRPAIWDMSFIGHSTFSVGLMGGYRSVSFDGESSSGIIPDVRIKARWHGAFVEASIWF